MILKERQIVRTPGFEIDLRALPYPGIQAVVAAFIFAMKRGRVFPDLPWEPAASDGRPIYFMKTWALHNCPAVVIAFEVTADDTRVIMHAIAMAETSSDN